MSRHKKKTATVTLIAVLSLFGLVYGFGFPATALAWDDCPRGLVDDPFPGECRRYKDTNGDGICDLSQPEPVVTTTTTTRETVATTTQATATATSGEPPTGDCPLGPCLGCGACFGVPVPGATASTGSATDGGETDDIAQTAGVATAAVSGDPTNTTTTAPSSGGSDSSATAASDETVASSTTDDSGGSSLMTHYMVSPIAVAFFLVYGASFILYKTKRIRLSTHRKIWNALLAVTFLVTGVFGLLLTIQLDYELPFKIPFDLLFWHVEAGIVMTLISLFHLGWHFNYYRNMLRTSRSKARVSRDAERVRTAAAGRPAAVARERQPLERKMSRGTAASRETIAYHAVAEPERTARTPRPRAEFEAE
ncbi:MAG: hypothetical protein LLG45_12920 [Actinomycetia bacterium]|nr:hypothetical protein [Actinomycetes bacterium]